VELGNSSCAIFEVLVRVVQKLEESRSFRCGETRVDFDFGFRRSESETENHE
jgi:hypothetical protein